MDPCCSSTDVILCIRPIALETTTTADEARDVTFCVDITAQQMSNHQIKMQMFNVRSKSGRNHGSPPHVLK